MSCPDPEYADQVVRLEQFQEAHPHIVIEFRQTRYAGLWTADWETAAGTWHIRELDLRHFIDKIVIELEKDEAP